MSRRTKLIKSETPVYSYVLRTRITGELGEKIAKRAAAEGRDISNFMRRFLEKHFAKA